MRLSNQKTEHKSNDNFSTFTGVIFLSMLILSETLLAFDSVANSKAIVSSDQVRFTVLAPELIRLEWNPENQFEDRASFVVITRNLPVPEYSTSQENGWLMIRTEKLTLKYRVGSGRFSDINLNIELMVNDQPVVWQPGIKDSLNLRGTTRTLDGWNGGTPQQLESGLISRSGWTLIDDSNQLLFDNSDWNWVMTRRAGDHQDWYFFGYGQDFKKCLFDYTQVAGKIPMPPEYAFGYWWSRYWVYSDQELRKLIFDFKTHGVPIDVLVIDMDWHETYGLNWKNDARDIFDQRIGWTGYTWNKSLFPNPDNFLKWKNRQHLKTALNLHPASGVPPMEERYTEFAKAFGFDTTGQKYIPFQMENKKFARVYFDVLLKPLENSGIDFWWLDWQQWPEAKTVKGLSNTWWLNYTFTTNMERSGRRPLIFHRWGGLGNHRYQIGFSGDAIVSWKSLAFETYFTATAANVGYGYWSHDIGGHNPRDVPTEPELYLRWLQFGVFSPIVRTHATKSNIMERRIWMFPEHYDMMKEAMELRYAMAPYIYTASRKAYDTGISICHPMYYESPDKKEAYQSDEQYYFGDDMIVAPIARPVETESDLAAQKIWLPEGQWYEWFTGTLLDGNRILQRKYAQNEIPLFVKAGAIIPMYPKIENLQTQVDTLVLTIIPGAPSQTELYEDDGLTTNYKNEGFTFTKITTEYPDQNLLKITVFPRQGHYAGMSQTRAYEVRLPNTLPPEKVTVNDHTYSYRGNLRPASWTYQGDKATTCILTPLISCHQTIELTISFSQSRDEQEHLLNNMVGKLRRLNRIVENIKWMSSGNYALPDWLYAMDQTGVLISYHPEKAFSELRPFVEKFESLPQELLKIDIGNPDFMEKNIRHLRFVPTPEEIEKEHNYQDTLKSLEQRIHIKYPYSMNYACIGKTSLFDGKEGTLRYFDEHWQGYEGVDLDVTLDLEKPEKIKKISAGFLQDIGNWIFLPVQVQVFVSDDGIRFHKAASIQNDIPDNKEGAFKQVFTKTFKNLKTRYIRIVAKNMGICPDWHRGAKTGKAWIFADEITIE